MKYVCPNNAYQTQETLFDKHDYFGIEYTNEQSLFKNLAIFEFESICAQDESFRDTETTKWIKKHIPISASISSNLVKEPIFLCNSDPHHLLTSFIGALKIYLSKKNEKLFPDIKTTIKIKLGSILGKLTQRHKRREQADSDDCDNKTCTSTQVLHIQKKPILVNERNIEPTVIKKAN